MGLYKAYFKKHGALFLTAVAMVFMEAFCDLLQPTIMSRLIDDGVKSGAVSSILRYGLLMLGVTAVGAIFATGRNILASRVSQKFGAELREALFTKILSFSETSADKLTSGSLMTRMTNDTSQVIVFINGLMRVFVKAPVTCLGSIILAVLLSPRLSLVLFAVIFAVTVLIVLSMKLSYARFAKVQDAIDKVNAAVQEYLMGVRLVKAFGLYDSQEAAFEEVNSALSKRSISSQLVIAYFSPMISLSVNIGILVIIYVGSLLFGQGTIQVGHVAAFLTYMAQILSSLLMITAVFNIFVRTKASTERITQVLNSDSEVTTPAPQHWAASAPLEFQQVTFAYPGSSGQPALNALSFRVEAGETLAVIGPTGSGKSTLAWLCLRFYDPSGGRILVGGEDIKTVALGSLRDAVSLAPQRSMLFSGTVRDNIAWGNKEATAAAIEEAAMVAQADAFIKAMPEGYDSRLGQGGVNISGGQKQRVSIARALLRRSPILILDDCTSALDTVTELKVRRGIRELTKGTVLLITQRVTTAMAADKILVLDNGANVGFGTHQELMQSCRIYKELVDSQIGEEFVRALS